MGPEILKFCLLVLVDQKRPCIYDSVAFVICHMVPEPQDIIGINPSVSAHDCPIIKTGLFSELPSQSLVLEEPIAAIIRLDVVLVRGGLVRADGVGEWCDVAGLPED